MRFVDEDKMTPVQLALETARYQFTLLHGCTIIAPGSGNYTYVFDDTEVNARIDAALKSLGLMETHDVPHTSSQ